MSSLDAIFTLQPEEVFEQTMLREISNLPDDEAIALLPRIASILAQEATAWAQHCAIVQSNNYASIIAEAYLPGADLETVKAKALYYVLETMPARFAALAGKNGVESLEPLSETLTILRNQVGRNGVRGSVEFGRADFRQLLHHAGFARAIAEQEEVMTELEDARLNHLRRMRMMLLGTRQLDFTSTKHVAGFVGMMEELGVDVQGIFLGAESGGEEPGGEESDAAHETEEE